MVPSRISIEKMSQFEASQPASVRRTAKVPALASYCSTHNDKTTLSLHRGSTLKKSKVGDSALLARGTALSSVIKCLLFSFKFYELCVII